MKIKNKEWVEFKKKILDTLESFSQESDKFYIPDEPENFELYFDECQVIPIFIKKPDSLRVEYDFTLCETKIRTLALSIYRETARFEITLKDNLEGKDSIWQESKI
jgi:hypothetical protein